MIILESIAIDHITDLMVNIYQLDNNKGRFILEPSAGIGNLVKAFKKINKNSLVFAYEINQDYELPLYKSGADFVTIDDFLNVKLNFKFSGCIANPPFGNETNIYEHFNHIRKYVVLGGKIVMIVPADFIPDVNFITIPIDNWTTNKDGTTTEIKIIHFLN